MDKTPKLIIAIDGAGASGKSSTSRELAQLLELNYLDTGLTYRLLTWLVLYASKIVALATSAPEPATATSVATALADDSNFLSSVAAEGAITISAAHESAVPISAAFKPVTTTTATPETATPILAEFTAAAAAAIINNPDQLVKVAIWLAEYVKIPLDPFDQKVEFPLAVLLGDADDKSLKKSKRRTSATGSASKSLDSDSATEKKDSGSATETVDITDQLRSSLVNQWVSQVSAIPEVRRVLIAWQKSLIAGQSRIVVEGRDITSVVAPEADLKIILTADAKVRQSRRTLENESKGETKAEGEVEAEGETEAERETEREAEGELRQKLPEVSQDNVVERDKIDLTVNDFETPSDGVVKIDNTDLTLEQTVLKVLELMRERKLS